MISRSSARAALRAARSRPRIARLRLRLNTSLATAQTAQPSLADAYLHPRAEHHPQRVHHTPDDSPQARYHKLVVHGTLREDEHQMEIIDKLQALHHRLALYNPQHVHPIDIHPSFFQKLFSTQSTAPHPVPPSNVPRGLYLYGDVGTGKSMLMDLFYNTLPRNIQHKRRVHFHAFMIDVHKRIHALKTAHPEGLEDPILLIARDLANEASVLCLDEFQVTDIVDAMILRRLLECLLQFGVVSVMTSNRHPTDLYKNGIQRSSFLPCIDLLIERFNVLDLGPGIDYRRVPRALSHVYFFPLSDDNRREINKIFEALTSDPDDLPIHSRPLRIWGRNLIIPESTSNVARFTFQELCGRPLSAADYLEVTRTFKTIFVTDVPHMSMDQKDMARRFITFVDACYESRTKLFTSSEVPIYQIFSEDTTGKSGHVSDHMRSVMDDLGLSEKVIGTTSIFSGEEEVFAFARACSRLVQMGTKEWAELTSQEHEEDEEREDKPHY